MLHQLVSLTRPGSLTRNPTPGRRVPFSVHWYDWLILGHASLVTLAATAAFAAFAAWRIIRFWLLRRLIVAGIATLFAALYLILPLDLLLDPILIDDLAVLLLAGWQWRRALLPAPAAA
ncbi:MAG: hypothetical protein K2Q23_14305 [Bryobacteraceae bacterium]|nr:hypothetical protein [Bryobacteraceae bacterium]